MKKAFYVMVCAITCMVTITSCGNSKQESGHYQFPSRSYSATFVPVEIQVSEQQQDTSTDGSKLKTITYTSSIYFLDSTNEAYTLNLKVKMVSDFTGKFSPEDLQSLKETKKFFIRMTKANPRTLYIQYCGELSTPCLYVHKQIVETSKPVRYINKAKVRELDNAYEEDKSIIWQSTSVNAPVKTIYANPEDRAEG